MLGSPDPPLSFVRLCTLCSYLPGRVCSTWFWTAPRGIDLRPWHNISWFQLVDLYFQGSTDTFSSPLQSPTPEAGVFTHFPSFLSPHSIWTQQGTMVWLGVWPLSISTSCLINSWASQTEKLKSTRSRTYLQDTRSADYKTGKVPPQSCTGPWMWNTHNAHH